MWVCFACTYSYRNYDGLANRSSELAEMPEAYFFIFFITNLLFISFAVDPAQRG
jgi:hypothetical protein